MRRYSLELALRGVLGTWAPAPAPPPAGVEAPPLPGTEGPTGPPPAPPPREGPPPELGDEEGALHHPGRAPAGMPVPTRIRALRAPVSSLVFFIDRVLVRLVPTGKPTPLASGVPRPTPYKDKDTVIRPAGEGASRPFERTGPRRNACRACPGGCGLAGSTASGGQTPPLGGSPMIPARVW